MKSTVTMRPHYLLALLAVVLPLVASVAATGQPSVIVGGWKPIKNIRDPEVKEIAEFAVSEYNKQAQTQGKNKLVFESVVSGDTQVVAGLKYRLVISAKNESSVRNPTATAAGAGATADNYEGVVWDKAWEHFRQLLSFRQLSKAN